jgi:hypothetical protein
LCRAPVKDRERLSEPEGDLDVGVEEEYSGGEKRDEDEGDALGKGEEGRVGREEDVLRGQDGGGVDFPRERRVGRVGCQGGGGKRILGSDVWRVCGGIGRGWLGFEKEIR